MSTDRFKRAALAVCYVGLHPEPCSFCGNTFAPHNGFSLVEISAAGAWPVCPACGDVIDPTTTALLSKVIAAASSDHAAIGNAVQRAREIASGLVSTAPSRDLAAV